MQENEEAADVDVDFVAMSGESSDEEETIMEEERLEGDVDHKRELDELKVRLFLSHCREQTFVVNREVSVKIVFVFFQADNEMSIDELAAKYANMSEELMDVDPETEGRSSIAFIIGSVHFQITAMNIFI